MKLITRKVDRLGRVVLPVNFRKGMGIISDTEVTIEIESDYIVIRKRGRSCKICSSENNLADNIELCSECIKKIKLL